VDQKSTPLGQTQGTTERRVLVDGKWLREGKRSDACGPPPMRGCVVQKESCTTPVPSYSSLNNIVKDMILKLKFEQLLNSESIIERDDVKRTEKKQIPLDPTDSEISEDVSLDAKDLIRAFSNESGETDNFDPLAGVDDCILNKILASHPVSLLDSQGSPLSKTKP